MKFRETMLCEGIKAEVKFRPEIYRTTGKGSAAGKSLVK